MAPHNEPLHHPQPWKPVPPFEGYDYEYDELFFEEGEEAEAADERMRMMIFENNARINEYDAIYAYAYENHDNIDRGAVLDFCASTDARLEVVREEFSFFSRQ